MKTKRIIFLVLILTLLSASSSIVFAGSWLKEPVNSGGRVFEYITNSVEDTRGMPAIGFWVSSEPSYRRIKIELQKRDYIPKPVSQGGGWQFVTIQEETNYVMPNRSRYMGMTYMSSLVSGDIRYKITVLQGGASAFSGSFEYFRP